jgi:hypothetical protein
MAKRRRTAATIPSDLQAALDHIHSGTSAHQLGPTQVKAPRQRRVEHDRGSPAGARRRDRRAAAEVPAAADGVLTARPLSGQPTPSSESSDVRWVPPSELPGYAMDRSMRIRINDFLTPDSRPVLS